MGLGKPQRFAKCEVSSFIYYRNVREFVEGAEFSLCQSTRDLLTSDWLPNGAIDILLIPNVKRLKDLVNVT